MEASNEHETDDLWVFGYGSLMWRPGFAMLERVPARLVGLHRALCVYSFVHRGTPERPGLVLGLDRGGMCRGIAYRVAAAKRDETIAYLRGSRAGHHGLSGNEAGGSGWRTSASPGAGALLHRRPRPRAICRPADVEQSVHYVRQGHGRSGHNRDYVRRNGPRARGARLPRERIASPR